jgi:DNA-directed RNA polymerase specialized sigma24 family protein
MPNLGNAGRIAGISLLPPLRLCVGFLLNLHVGKKASKHGGKRHHVELGEADWITATTPDELLAVDEALEKLASEDGLAAEIVKLRYFVGMSVEEAADVLGLSRATAYRHWTYARAWLRCSVTG